MMQAALAPAVSSTSNHATDSNNPQNVILRPCFSPSVSSVVKNAFLLCLGLAQARTVDKHRVCSSKQRCQTPSLPCLAEALLERRRVPALFSLLLAPCSLLQPPASSLPPLLLSPFSLLSSPFPIRVIRAIRGQHSACSVSNPFVHYVPSVANSCPPAFIRVIRAIRGQIF